jgi:peptidoglycan/xylan/chitin deacetylase (PgdA/CDA1 family)
VFSPLLTRARRRIARHLLTKPFVMFNTAPLVSFTFDDIPDSVNTNGAAVLDEYNIRATFYVASGSFSVVARPTAAAPFKQSMCTLNGKTHRGPDAS